jgi:hypothetical protein
VEPDKTTSSGTAKPRATDKPPRSSVSRWAGKPQYGAGAVGRGPRTGSKHGFCKLPLLRAPKRAYPAEKITWVVSEDDSPYRLTMAEIVRPYLARSWSTRICAGRLR